MKTPNENDLPQVNAALIAERRLAELGLTPEDDDDADEYWVCDELRLDVEHEGKHYPPVT